MTLFSAGTMQAYNRSSASHDALSSTEQSKSERRARRDARRQKQRDANVHRARTMHTARLAAVQDDRAKTPPRLAASRPCIVPEVHVGCSGWFYWHWRGAFYPLSIPPNKWFDHYSRQFKTVELNAPFYSWPTVGTVASWKRQVGRRHFVYTVKVCELITHIKRFSGTKTLIRDFGYIADLLGKQMGCLLFQLPPSFHYTPARLHRILRQLDPNQRNVVEFRHRSWWIDDVFDAFRMAGAIFCSCSGPRLPDQLVKTADDVYIRFHGTRQWYRHDYSKEELTIWADRIVSSGARRVWVYFNNDRDGYAISNARMLLRLIHGSLDAGNNRPLF